MVMNESVGILKSASSGNQGQMVIFYESCKIIKPNELDYFGGQICQTWRWLCKCYSEDVSFQKPWAIISSLVWTVTEKKQYTNYNYIHVGGLIKHFDWAVTNPKVPTVQVTVNLFLNLSCST